MFWLQNKGLVTRCAHWSDWRKRCCRRQGLYALDDHQPVAVLHRRQKPKLNKVEVASKATGTDILLMKFLFSPSTSTPSSGSNNTSSTINLRGQSWKCRVWGIAVTAKKSALVTPMKEYWGAKKDLKPDDRTRSWPRSDRQICDRDDGKLCTDCFSSSFSTSWPQTKRRLFAIVFTQKSARLRIKRSLL